MRIQYFFIAILSLLLLPFSSLLAQEQDSDSFPVRGFAIAAPQVQEVDRFIKFIQEELGPRDINVLILRVDYGYEFTSHPELREKNALSLSDVKKIVYPALCIRIVKRRA